MSGSGDLLQDRLGRIEAFLSLKPGWDSYRAPPVSKAAADAASATVRAIHAAVGGYVGSMIGLSVGPSIDGGISLEWSLMDRTACIDAHADGTLSAWRSDSGNDDEWAISPSDVGPIVSWMVGGKS